MRLSHTLVWGLLALTTEAKRRHKKKSACPARPPRTSFVQVTVTRGSALPSSETASESASFSATAVSSAESSAAAESSLASAIPSSSAAVAPEPAISSSIEPVSTIESILSSISAVASSVEAPISASASASSSIETSTVIISTTITSSEAAAASSTETPTSTSTTPAPVVTDLARNYPADAVDELRDESMSKLEEFLGKRTNNNACTLENVAIRREWSDLSLAERADYISAVQCLQTKPAKTPANVASGAKSRFDDFVVAHIQLTPLVHNTANFLSWHRYYLWAYETALRDECGYKGWHPYWNWDRYAADPVNSPLFNGNATSIGGNSVNGGCVTSGPFKDMSVNVGPGGSLRHNPRCLKRDISGFHAARTTADRTLPLITQSRSIGDFQNRLQLPDGVHASGHFTIGGDPGGDIYASPGDPAFYLHHAMVDRVWWLWQLQDLDTRLSAVAGRNGNFGNGGALGALGDTVHLGLVAGGVSLGSLLDTMGGKGGEFCYIYM